VGIFDGASRPRHPTLNLRKSEYNARMNRQQEIASLFAPARYAGVLQTIDSASTLPPYVYTSDEFLQMELKEVFESAWLLVGHVDDIAERSGFYATETPVGPLLVTRTRDGVLNAFVNSCRQRGTLLVQGAGRADSLVCPYRSWRYDLDGTLRNARGMRFDKNEHLVDTTMRGYLPRLYRSYEGEERAGTSHQEGFWIGHDRAPSARVPLDCHNRWPEFAPTLRPAMEAYFAAVETLSHTLMRGFALALGLPPDALQRLFRRPLSRLKLNHHPPPYDIVDAHHIGVVPHSDSGGFTILWQDENGGLEVQSKSGDWVVAPPVEDAFVINLGNVMQVWTDGYFASTPHRVINRAAGLGDDDARGRCIAETCFDDVTGDWVNGLDHATKRNQFAGAQDCTLSGSVVSKPAQCG
jgi:isopenicillin N synthase-like dioxygenase